MSIKYNRDDTVAGRVYNYNYNVQVASLLYDRKTTETIAMNSSSTYKYIPGRHCRVYATMRCTSSEEASRNCRVRIAGKQIGIFGTSTSTNTTYPEHMQVNGPILDLWPGDEVTFQTVSGSTSFELVLHVIPFWK